MKKIKLTKGKSTWVDKEDYTAINRNKWCYSPLGYAYRKVQMKGKKQYAIYMHRFILDVWDDRQIDHINRNKLDNRKINLRKCFHFQNKWNRGKQKGNTSGYKGVIRAKTKSEKWVAQIAASGKHYYLGIFKTKKEAFNAYKKAAKKLHGNFAKWD